ncbi:T9SS type B sorting domain-containing protein [Flavobacteriaceae bacterium R38]|nr:T9SS type B sorting domain-containing protein [Flavobacteriaceae bacterium R38]
MIRTFTSSMKSIVLLLFFVTLSVSVGAQQKFQTGNKSKKKTEQKAQAIKPGQKAKNAKSTPINKVDNAASRRAQLLKKYPQEARSANNISEIEEEGQVVNRVPSVSQALQGIQQGKQYNLKKVLKNNGGEGLFTTGRQDNPILRQEYNFKRLVDPKTGEIPEGIREKELEYVKSSRSQMQTNDGLIQSSANIPFATPGMQIDPWVNRGPFNVGGRTRALAIDINDENRILAGGVSGGLWESTDQGSTWSRITPAQEHPSITDIVQDPRPGFQNIWYYGTGESIGNSASGRNGSGLFVGNGVYISTDNAQTFTPLPATVVNTPQGLSTAEPFELIYAVDVNPLNGNLYVATLFGIYRSTDLGATFEPVLLNGGGTTVAGVVTDTDLHITSSGVLYATLESNATDAGIFRSTDGAAGTWVNITDPAFPATFGRTVVYTAPSNENILYVYSAGTPTAPIGHDFWKYTYISGDGTGAGGTWEDRSTNLPNFGDPVGDATTQGGYDIYVRVHPNDENLVFLGGINIFRSFDGFATRVQQFNDGWIAGYSPINNVSLYTNHHPDQHSLEFFPSNPDMVISGHDGGLSLTTDIQATGPAGATEPVTWTSLNNGYLTTQVYALSIGPQDQIMAGFQDNSTWFTNTTNTTADWTDLFSGDGSYNAFSDDGATRYVSAQNGQAFRITYPDANSTAATSFQNIQPAGATGFLFVNPFELDPNDDTLMYFAAGGSLWRNDDLPNATQTVGWTQLTNAPSPGGTISTIGVSTTPANVVYYGTTTGSVVRIDGANTGDPTGVNVSTGLPPGANVTSIAVDPNNSNNVYAAFSNYSIPSIFFSNNGGATWTDISGNLEVNPDGSGAGPSVRWITIVGNNDLFLVGTSTGMYSTQTINGASTVWTQVDPNGIGNVVVEQIRTREDGLVVAGTHGNGLYSASFEVSVPTVLVDNPIPNQEVAANSADLQLDVSNVFISNATPALPITVTVDNNSDPAILSASITGNTLTISLVPDAFGSATITLRGEDTNTDFALSSFDVTVTPPPINTFPYIQDFESGTLPLGYETSGPFPWIINSGGTPSGGTGPLGDNTSGAGFYIYTEASGGAEGDQGFLLTRELDLSPLTNPVMEFNYHMFGAGIGSLDLEVVDVTNGGTVTNIFSISGPQQGAQGDSYLNSTVLDLSPFSGSVIQLRFIGTRGPLFTSDIAIDDILVMERAPDDIGITDITVSNDPFFGNTETVEVEITNFGTASQSNFDVTYILDGGTPVTETFTGTVNGNSTATYTFTVTADLSVPGVHIIQASTTLAADSNNANDSLTEQFNTIPIINTFPYTEPLEGLGGILPGGWDTSGTLPWLLNSGGTPSGGTGPSADNTIGDATGTYIFAEASGFNPGDQGSFTTGAFDIRSLSAPTLSFFYHMFGTGIGTLDVEVLDVSNNTVTNVFTLSGQQQTAATDPYILARIDLTPFNTSPIIQLRFTSTRGADFAGDIAVDDLSIFQLPDDDLAIANASAPLLASNTDNLISVEITNLGVQTQSGFNVSYQVTGQAAVVEQFTGSIARGETNTFTFTTPLNLATLGPINVDVTLELVSDVNPGDNSDSFDALVLNGVNTFPYVESFEADNGSWFNFQGVNSTFELGAPANTNIDGASDGTQAWVTNLTGDYNSDEQSTVVSPLFDFSTLADPVIQLDINYDIESTFDGAILQFTTDNGLTWQNVGQLGDLPNWYNATLVSGSLGFASTSTDSWGGTTGGYQLAIHALDGLGTEASVALRIVFGSDGSVAQEGFAFDNVRIGSDAGTLFQITCPENIVADNDLGVCEATLTVPQPIFTNATGTVVFSNSFNDTEDASGVYPVGITEVVWTATDDTGIVRTCTMTITVNDTEAPTITCLEDIVVENDLNTPGAVVNFSLPTVEDNCMSASTITQSDNQTLVAGNFVVCPPGPNSYLRVFDLPAEGFTGDFIVESLDFGIEQSSALSGEQPSVTANIYLYDPATPLLFANLTLLGSQNMSVPDGNTFLLNVPFDTPVTIPAGSTVVVELFTPSGNDGATPTLTMVGQPDGARGISYLASAACGVDEPTDVDAVGLGDIDADWVMNINSPSEPIITQTAGLASGSLFPIGVTTNTFSFTDSAGNTSECSFNVTVEALMPSPSSGISPNQDGVNDTWVIENISNFPQAQIFVFDRNGREVFRTTNYQNDWAGTEGANGGSQLPVGSYYYTINIFQPGAPQVTGWFYLNY